jgi:hypothetical protein
VQSRPGEPRRRCTDDVTLDLPRAARSDELAADGAQKRVRHGREPQRPKTAQPRQGAAQERVLTEAGEELGVIVVEAEHEAQLVEAALVGRTQLDGAVRLLPRTTEAAYG